MSTGIDLVIKWPGGKRTLLAQILPILPHSFARYVEPFLGGGALYFRLNPAHARIGDLNPDLINCYQQIRNAPLEVIAHLKTYRNSEDDYYKIRPIDSEDPAEQAAQFIYLATLSFNGIYRVNLRGHFNVPYGHKTHLDPSDSKRILAASRVFQNADLQFGDFEFIADCARAKDLVYLDPPYTVSHSNNGFVKYNANLFSWEVQVRLAQFAMKLASRGCFVVVSNADHASIHELYSSFKCRRLVRSSVIAASPKHRGLVTECLFHYP